MHLWVLLPSLPFPLWNHSLLEGISNTIGWFITVEEDFMLTFDKRMGKILVEMDISEGLPTKVEILCQEHLFSQQLDYLNIPFRCSRCREVGHLRRQCLHILQGVASPSFHISSLVRRPSYSCLRTSSHSPHTTKSTPASKGIYSNACSLFKDASD